MPSARHRLKKPLRWPDLWFRDRPSSPTPPLNHVLSSPMPLYQSTPDHHLHRRRASLVPPSAPAPDGPDLTALLSDELLLRILSYLPSPSRNTTSLVCKRWLRLLGRLRRSLTLLDWSFLLRGRLQERFPALDDIDLLPASILLPPVSSGIVLTRGAVSVPLDCSLDPDPADGVFLGECRFLHGDSMNRGVGTIGEAFPCLQRLSLAAVASEDVVIRLAEECQTLQELDLHRCTDLALRPISAFANLQILRLVGSVEGLYSGVGVTDIGLTILAHGCKRLVKLELSGCEGSYDGISAIGRCCFMLEELTFFNHRMDEGWMAGLSYCSNLKTLKLMGCRRIDTDPGPTEHLGSCPTIERLHIHQCQLRDKRSLNALLMICDGVKDVVFQDCWGLDNDMFSIACICRRVKFLCLEGCSQLTTEGLESVILSWKELQSLSVVSCNNIKDIDVSPALSTLFATLKEFKWRPDSHSVLAASLKGTGMGRKGGRFFKRA